MHAKVEGMTVTTQASEVQGHDDRVIELGSTKSHLVFRFVAAELLIVCFVFAGVIKAVPWIADIIPWDLTMIFGGLAVFSFLLRGFTLGKFEHLRLVPADLWLIALALVLAVGSFNTTGSSSNAIMKTVNFAFFGVLASYAFPRFLSTLSSPMSVLRNCLLTLLTLAGFLLLLTFVTKAGLTLFRTPGGSYLSWGYMLGGAIIAACTFLAMARSKLQSLPLLLLMLLLVAALVYARGRGPFIALFGVSLATTVVYKWVSLRRRFLFVLGCSLALAALLIAMPEELRSRYERILSDEVGASIEERVDAYEIAWDMFLNRPFSGMGTGSYSAYHERFAYPHNIILEAMAENGIIGLTLLVGFIGSVWVGVMRALRKSSGRERILIAGAGLIFLFMLIGSMFSGDLTSRTLMFSAGLAAAAGHIQRSDRCIKKEVRVED